MTKISLQKGVWPVMLTPFCTDGSIDWKGVDALVEWYIKSGVAGLFAVCLSSEMYHLSTTDRLELATRVVQRAAGRVPVVSAGAFGDNIQQQIEMVNRFTDTGVTAVVLTVNQLATESDSDMIWQNNAALLCAACEDIALGLYECPQPYHRTLTPESLRWAAESGYFNFYKDTCCRRDLIEKKLVAVQGTSLCWFNAHCPTLLHSLQIGGHGFSGIAANFYPKLFVRLCREYMNDTSEAQKLQRFLTLLDPTIRMNYPASAKQYHGRLGLQVGPTCRLKIPTIRADDDEILILANLHKTVTNYGSLICA